MPGYTNALSAAAFNAAEAKKALAASKYAGNLPKIIFSKTGYANRKDDYADALVNMWRQTLGVTVEVRYLDPQDYVKASREQHGQITLGSWCADYPDPENFLDVLFHSASEFNYAGYRDAQVDALVEQARVAQDGAARIRLYQQVERKLLETYALIPVSHSQTFVLVKPQVKGFTLAPLGIRILNLVSLER
jgi:ABC-type oligopeptide transport system substrate-binding subunit